MPDNTSSIIPIGGGGSGGGAATSVTVGTTTVAGGGANRVLYEDASQILGAEAAFTYVATTDTLTVVNAVTTTITGSGLTEFSGQTNISGPDATTNVEIGSTANDANAGTGGTSVVIGNGATNSGNGTNNVLIGSGVVKSGAGGQATLVGQGITATTSVGSTAIGQGATVDASITSTGLGAGTVVNSSTSSVALGYLSNTATLSNVLVSGNVGAPINNVYFGKGVTSTSATAATINGTGGSGADNAGGGLNLAGGIATGAGTGGNVVTKTSARSTTSSTAQTLVDRYVAVAGTKNLTAGAATGIVRIGVPQGLTGPVGVTIYYSVRAADATDFQLRRGSVHIAAVNKAGTETAVISAASEVLDGSVLAQSSASTLTYALTVTSNSADTIDFEINAVSGLTETTLDCCYSVIRDHGVGTIVPL